MVNKTEKLDNKENVSVRACIMFSCLLYGDYYIHLLSFRMKIADNKTSQGILQNAKSFLLYHKYARTETQST